MGKEVSRKGSPEDEQISILNQLVKTAEDSFKNLKKAHMKDDAESFNKSKALLIQTQRRISEVLG